MLCTCVFQKVLGMVLVQSRFANTEKSIGNTNTYTYFKQYCNTLAILLVFDFLVTGHCALYCFVVIQFTLFCTVG